jgi:hypothetical protein
MAAYRKYHEPVKRTTIWMPEALKDGMTAAAEAQGVSQAQWLQDAVRQKLGHDEQPAPNVFG